MSRHVGTNKNINNVSLVRIIIVASDESVRKMLTMIVQVEYVAEVVSVRGGKAALEAVPRLLPKLVIIHGNLQGMRALTLATRLHAITDLAQLSIVLTHALDVSENDRRRPFLFILGPSFVLEEFYATIAAVLMER